jgi:peptidoglycan hydrolase-like protein with peptidoglycan-binding domain
MIMQVKLKHNGYYPDEEDCKWWMFGPSTLSAVTTFQACCGLPETGVCDRETWKALMGTTARPQDIENVFSGDSDDEDLEEQGVGRVYLLGEQRWSLPVN